MDLVGDYDVTAANNSFLPVPKVTSSNCLFHLTCSLKPIDTKFPMIQYRKKQKTLIFEELEIVLEGQGTFVVMVTIAAWVTRNHRLLSIGKGKQTAVSHVKVQC